MHGYTVDEIMATRPCADYPRERVEELWGGRESLTVVEIAALDISISDRLYQVIRLLPLESIPVLARRYADDAATCVYSAQYADAAAHTTADAAALERYLEWAVEAHQ
ncbi:MAG: hypothetical protein WC406_13460 [Methanoregula sp.]|jgi:hypothetical protein